MTSDEQQNLPAIPEQVGEVAAIRPIPVGEFEGEYVRHMLGKLPGVTLPMDHGYPRGAHLKMEMEVRVRSVRVDEMKGKNAGELSRLHEFTLEDIKIIGVYSADQADPGVGGSAAATGHDIEDEDDETDESPEGESDERAEHGEPDVGF